MGLGLGAEEESWGWASAARVGAVDMRCALALRLAAVVPSLALTALCLRYTGQAEQHPHGEERRDDRREAGIRPGAVNEDGARAWLT